MFKGVYWVLYAKDFSQLSHWIHLNFREICIALQFPIVAMNSVFLNSFIHWKGFVNVLHTVGLFKIFNSHTLCYEVLVLCNLKYYARMHSSIIIDNLKLVAHSWWQSVIIDRNIIDWKHAIKSYAFQTHYSACSCLYFKAHALQQLGGKLK